MVAYKRPLASGCREKECKMLQSHENRQKGAQGNVIRQIRIIRGQKERSQSFPEYRPNRFIQIK